MMEKNKQLSIVINEDNTDFLDLLSAEFAHQGFRVIPLDRSEKSFHEICQHTPDLLLTDIMMPDFNGIELAHKLYQQQIFLPIIVMSGHERLEDEIFLFIEKPFHYKNFVTFVHNNYQEIRDIQQLKYMAKINNLSEKQVGKVIVFYPDKGWGLLKVIGYERPIYINASDLLPKNRFAQLYHGQFLHFILNLNGPKGMRATEARIIHYTNRPLLITEEAS